MTQNKMKEKALFTLDLRKYCNLIFWVILTIIGIYVVTAILLWVACFLFAIIYLPYSLLFIHGL